MSEKAQKNTQAKAWLKREMLPYRLSVFFLSALTAVGAVLSLSFAYLTRYLVNGAFEKSRRLLIVFAAVLAGIVVARVILQATTNYLSERTRAKITVGLRNRLFNRILCADYLSFEQYHSGDLLNRLTTDVGEVASDSVGILPAVTGMAIQAVGAFAALLTLDRIFTAIYFAGAVVVVGASVLLRKKTKQYHRETVEADGENRAFIQESFSSALTLKAYDAETRSTEKSEKILGKYFRKRMRRNRLRTVTGGAFSLVGSAGLLFAVIWYGVRVMNGSMDYGSILSVVLLLGQIQHPVTTFSSVMPLLYARTASAERLCEIDGMPREDRATVKEDPETLYQSMSAIRIDRLSFGYDGREEVLADASAVIGKGETVCLTGNSGCGKSTLFKLLLGVYSPSSGGIFLETEKGDLPLSAAERGLFAYVPQGNFLFSGTVRENLAFFSSAADDMLEEQIGEALRTACAEFVYDLPEGLDTPLRERGSGLSEGQLQRLAVARALLSERPVLLLDEATSALDGETESRLLENIGKLKEKTCILVTHRSAALSIADRVLCLRAGKLETAPDGAETERGSKEL